MEFFDRESDFVDFNGNLNDSALLLPYLLASLLRAQGKMVGSTVVERMAGAVFGQIENLPRDNWEEWLLADENNAFSDYEVGERLHLLDAYTFFGIDYCGDAGLSVQEIARIRKADLDRVSPLADLLPILHSEPDLAERAEHGEAFFLRMLEGARSRIALDLGERVPVAGLAVLANISESRMRSIAKRNDDARLPVGEDRMVPNDKAKDWLSEQAEFLPTVTNESDEPVVEEIVDPIFVPVAADGSRFDITLRQGNGYQVGPKGSERIFSDYDSALGALTRMPVAYWRRPSEGSGRFGIVRATHWERVSRMDDLFHEES